MVRAPLGIALVRGLEVTFGAQPVRRAPFNTCLSNGCQAVLILSKPLQEEILKAERALITVYAPNGQSVSGGRFAQGPGHGDRDAQQAPRPLLTANGMTDG